eukprot:TRINITY_DN30038_c0_g2_i2.p1 TRINITY_DN30038_c0_g2~~TRINITY_DN30038_c0_g2_i2.p1  ORF type:complete len:234 (-),score=21.97 TRINITY_DN30038_c0_g2_i2:19-720(-)
MLLSFRGEFKVILYIWKQSRLDKLTIYLNRLEKGKMLLGKKIINSVNLLSRSQYVGYQRLIATMADQDDEKEEQLQLNNHNVKDQSKTLSEPIESVSQLLMGADMSNAYPRVLSAQSLPIIGNMQPPLFKVMDDISTGLQYLFQTESPYTAALSGGQICGMEACLFNLLQPGEKLLVLNMGEIGKRAVDIGERAGLEIVNFSQDPGQTFSLQEVRQASLSRGKQPRSPVKAPK